MLLEQFKQARLAGRLGIGSEGVGAGRVDVSLRVLRVGPRSDAEAELFALLTDDKLWGELQDACGKQ
jgi:hypothetical protein